MPNSWRTLADVAWGRYRSCRVGPINQLVRGLPESRVGGNDRTVNSVSDGLAMDFVCVVRQAKPEELPQLSELCLRSKGIWGYDQAFLDACRSELTFKPKDLQTSRIGVADTEKGVAGVVQVRIAGTEADLLKLFIEPRRIRSGIGTILFRWGAGQARSMGANRMFIEADPDAAPFYRRVGAYDVGLAPSYSIPGRLLPRLVFALT
jgi:GNAT superfamily N-acetyltransferase